MVSDAPFYSRSSTTYLVAVVTWEHERDEMRMTDNLHDAVEAALAIADSLGIAGRTGARRVDVTLANNLVVSIAVVEGGLRGP